MNSSQHYPSQGKEKLYAWFSATHMILAPFELTEISLKRLFIWHSRRQTVCQWQDFKGTFVGVFNILMRISEGCSPRVITGMLSSFLCIDDSKCQTHSKVPNQKTI